MLSFLDFVVVTLFLCRYYNYSVSYFPPFNKTKVKQMEREQCLGIPRTHSWFFLCDWFFFSFFFFMLILSLSIPCSRTAMWSRKGSFFSSSYYYYNYLNCSSNVRWNDQQDVIVPHLVLSDTYELTPRSPGDLIDVLCLSEAYCLSNKR